VPIIHSKGGNFKVVTEESNSVSSLSSDESVAPNRSDNSDKFSNLVNFLKNYDSMPDMESIVNQMDITMNEINTKVAKSLSNCSKTDKKIDNKNTIMAESLVKSLSNNKTDKTIEKNIKVVKIISTHKRTNKTIEKNTKVAQTLTKSPSIDNKTDSLNLMTNQSFNDFESLSKLQFQTQYLRVNLYKYFLFIY
jgi:hypothetical protein